jgi:hypothetical protein
MTLSLFLLSQKPLNKRCIQHVSPLRELEQLFRLIQETMSHLACDLHDALFLRPLDHRPNVQLRPHSQAGSANSGSCFDFFAKGTPDALRIVVNKAKSGSWPLLILVAKSKLPS